MGPYLKNGLPRAPSGKKGKVFVEDKSALLQMIDAMPRFRSSSGSHSQTEVPADTSHNAFAKGDPGRGKNRVVQARVSDKEKEHAASTEAIDGAEELLDRASSLPLESDPLRGARISSQSSASKHMDKRKRNQAALKQAKSDILLAAKQKKQARRSRGKQNVSDEPVGNPILTAAGDRTTVAEAPKKKRKSVGFALP